MHTGGMWGVPGGKVEISSGNIFNIIEQTLSREILEEVGIEIENNVKLLTNNSFIRSTGHHVVSLYFECKWKSGIAMPLSDISDTLWIKKEDVELYTYPENLKFILFLAFKNI